MDLNLLPEDARPPQNRGESCPRSPCALTVEGVRIDDLLVRIHAARQAGFGGIELSATGEAGSLHAPAVSPDDRAALCAALGEGTSLAVLAPTQATFDLTLVSPSAAIRRASVTELWSVCRFAGSLVSAGGATAATVVIRTGAAPLGTAPDRETVFLSECLTTLDRMAGDHGARVAVLNADFFRDPLQFPALRSLKLPHTGVTLDVRAALDQGRTVADLAQWVRYNADLLFHVRVGGDTVSPALEPFALALAEARYTGLVSLVPSGDKGYGAGTGDTVAAAARAWWDERLRHGPSDNKGSNLDA